MYSFLSVLPLFGLSLFLSFVPVHSGSGPASFIPQATESQELTAPIPAGFPFTTGDSVAIKCDLNRYMSLCEDCQTMKYATMHFTASFHWKNPEPGEKEVFKVHRIGDKFAFEGYNGKFLGWCGGCEKKDGLTILVASDQDPQKIKDIYLFSVDEVSHGKYTLRASNGRYVTRFHHPGVKSTQVAAVYYTKTDRPAGHFEIVEVSDAGRPKMREQYQLVRLGNKVSEIAKGSTTIQKLYPGDISTIEEIIPGKVTGGFTANSHLGNFNPLGNMIDFFVAETDREIYIAFRGTQLEKLNAVNNICMWIGLADYDKILGQSCYGEVARKFYNEIKERVNFSGKRVLITGHSQGGAVAAYLTFLLLKNNLLDKGQEHRLVTLSAPRYAVAQMRERFEFYRKNRAPGMSVDAFEVQGDPVTNSLNSIVPQELKSFGVVTEAPVDDNPANVLDRHFCCNYLEIMMKKKLGIEDK